jgi:ABC-type multidrug transport system ATPase subunit
MEINFDNVSKKFGSNYIIKKFSASFKKNPYAITGNNGSGKTTLLKLIANLMIPSEGKIRYLENGLNLEKESISKKIFFTAPYQELIEELTIKEFLIFHYKFRKYIDEPLKILSNFKLESFRDTIIKNLSSGTQQKLKLLISFNTVSDFILLDEPTTNLDNNGKKIYRDAYKKYSNKRGVIIATNSEDDIINKESEIINLS